MTCKVRLYTKMACKLSWQADHYFAIIKKCFI